MYDRFGNVLLFGFVVGALSTLLLWAAVAGAAARCGQALRPAIGSGGDPRSRSGARAP